MLASPISVTSAPAVAAPSAKARDMPGEDGRMSWPTTTLVGARHRHERVAHPSGELLVDLVGHGAPHVVRLEHGGQVGGVGRRHATNLASVRRLLLVEWVKSC